jgi:hypothetical protein
LWGELCCCLTDYSYYSYSRKSTGREFFVPARTLIAVKLLNSILKADAVAKSGDDSRVGTSGWRVGDSEVRSKHNNQPLDDEDLCAKAAKKLVVHQPWKEGT